MCVWGGGAVIVVLQQLAAVIRIHVQYDKLYSDMLSYK